MLFRSQKAEKQAQAAGGEASSTPKVPTGQAKRKPDGSDRRPAKKIAVTPVSLKEKSPLKPSHGVMDFPLDDSGVTVFSSSSSSSPFLRPNCLAGFAGDCRSLSPPRRSSSLGLSLSFWCGSWLVKLLRT